MHDHWFSFDDHEPLDHGSTLTTEICECGARREVERDWAGEVTFQGVFGWEED